MIQAYLEILRMAPIKTKDSIILEPQFIWRFYNEDSAQKIINETNWEDWE